ncbi:hypothetical protein BC827DRAFT_1135796, partial [Russula dissimulans]
YDFSKVDIGQLKDRARELEEQQRGMKKNVKLKVMNMTDTVDKRDASLKNMLGSVLKDKEKIEQIIEELDRYKRDALKTTWEKVNGDFGGIFAELSSGQQCVCHALRLRHSFPSHAYSPTHHMSFQPPNPTHMPQ